MNEPIKIAYHLISKKYIHIDNAENGLACNCICKECNERLEAIQGNERINHFRHHSNINCKGSPESALHELGKQILIDNKEISIPKYGKISYSDPIAEKQFKLIRPDVLAKVEGFYILFEIYVTHAIDTEKEQVLIDEKLNSIEIDLRRAEKLKYSEIKRLVLDEISNKRLIFWNNKDETKSVSTNNLKEQETTISTGEMIAKVIIGVFLGIGVIKVWKYLINGKYKKKKYYKKPRNYRFK